MISYPGRGVWQRSCRAVSVQTAKAKSYFSNYDISIFQDFVPPPTGGGNQFLRALKREWEGRGWRVEVNTLSKSTKACLLNSFNFDADRFRFLRRKGCRVVHRVDGPLLKYRGSDDGTDRKIAIWNQELADRTILQSKFSLEAHRELGLIFRDPVIITNAADPEIFYPPEQRFPLSERKLRLLSASWSDNRNKGAEVYEWLDQHLDFSRIDYTFAGRLSSPVKNIKVLPPLPSHDLADLLRKQDIYLTASRHDPCSNSLIEALSCGLPVIYLKSGGHPELVGGAGIGFSKADEIPALLEGMRGHLERFHNKIRTPNIVKIADKYLEVLGLPGKGTGD